MTWRLEDILDALVAGVDAQETRLRNEHAVHGLDALSEVGLHAVLGAGLEEAGYAVFREQPYPTPRVASPRESERDRCDLVLAPAGTASIADRVRLDRERSRSEGTLFQGLAETLVQPASGSVDPTEALWLEVKTIGQFTFVDGLSGPNRSYASQFGPCVADVRKLASAIGLGQTGLVVVLFCASREVGEHDLAALVHRCLDRDLPVGGLRVGHAAIGDRIGNQVCTVGVVDVRPISADG